MGKGFSKIIAGLVVCAFVLCFGFADNAFSAKKNKSVARHVPGELVVKFKKVGSGVKVKSLALETLVKVMGKESILSIRPIKTRQDMSVIRFAEDKDIVEAAKVFSGESYISYAEPNYLYHALDDGIPNDPDFGKVWGVYNTGQNDSRGSAGKPGADVNVLPLWQQGIVGSKNIVVAVIDTGVDWDHPDLKDNIYINPGEAGSKANNGIDDDNNGFVDDIHGWNFAGKNNNSRDDNDHGSHCSGTIGSTGNNGVGIVGVNWRVSIMPVKFLDARGGGTLADAVSSIDYARMMHVNVMSNSWGGGGFSQALKDAIVEAKNAGILFIAAAGNESNNNDSSPTYPAGYKEENVIAVAALDNQDRIASFSNFGAKTVHVAAPGVNVYSTVKGGKYNSFSGTSMACPHVAGVAALLKSANSDWDYNEIKRRLIATSDPIQELRNKVLAKGRVNAANAMNGVAPPSDEPDESQWVDVPYVVESEHPYQNRQNYEFEIKHSGAKFIRVHFSKIETEAKYDKVILKNARGEAIETITGNFTNYTTDYVSGGSAKVFLTTDYSNTGWGFAIDKIQVIK